MRTPLCQCHLSEEMTAWYYWSLHPRMLKPQLCWKDDDENMSLIILALLFSLDLSQSGGQSPH